MTDKLSCSAKNHVGCGAYRANLEILANKFNSTPQKVEAVLKNSRNFQNYAGCWGAFTRAVLKNSRNMKLLRKLLKQT
jgi:uncharacterized tellurite resistance protein B-like protein